MKTLANSEIGDRVLIEFEVKNKTNTTAMLIQHSASMPDWYFSLLNTREVHTIISKPWTPIVGDRLINKASAIDHPRTIYTVIWIDPKSTNEVWVVWANNCTAPARCQLKDFKPCAD